jgi:hypothetical protein
MLVNKPRVINYLIQNLQVCLNFPCNLFILMCRVLHQNQLVERNIMLALLMISVNSPGFISSSSSLRCFRSFEIFRTLLSGSLIKKSLLFNLIGETSIRSLLPSSSSLASLIMCLAHMLISKTVQ